MRVISVLLVLCMLYRLLCRWLALANSVFTKCVFFVTFVALVFTACRAFIGSRTNAGYFTIFVVKFAFCAIFARVSVYTIFGFARIIKKAISSFIWFCAIA